MRDKLVTGVQTCALPICHALHLALEGPHLVEPAQRFTEHRAIARDRDFLRQVADARAPRAAHAAFEIGRASCRERVLASVVDLFILDEWLVRDPAPSSTR